MNKLALLVLLLTAQTLSSAGGEIPELLSPGEGSASGVINFVPMAGLAREVRFRIERTMTVEMDSPSFTDPNFAKRQKLGPPMVEGARMVRHLRQAKGVQTYEDTLTHYQLTASGLPTGYTMPNTPPQLGIEDQQACLESQKGVPIEFSFNAAGERVWALPKSAETICNKDSPVIDELENLYRVVFPAEPIAAGAKWRVSRLLMAEGNPVNLTCDSVFKLETIDGARATFTVEVSGSAKNVDSPNTMQGATKSVLDVMALKGKGRIVVDLSFPEPVESVTETTFSYQLSVFAGETKTKILFESTTKRTNAIVAEPEKSGIESERPQEPDPARKLEGVAKKPVK